MPIRITAPIIFIIIYCSVIFIRNGLHSHAAYEAWASQGAAIPTTQLPSLLLRTPYSMIALSHYVQFSKDVA